MKRTYLSHQHNTYYAEKEDIKQLFVKCNINKLMLVQIVEFFSLIDDSGIPEKMLDVFV